ncbi:hypothetical protein D9757_010155 [Collybiopsis confluens]|uniref:CBD9-like protein n=1 Tax=Collybiopsis confluens TaxID=2823264 RepID=A0A8H5H0M4_9AGAR|nr:hypothetical protein D9757_010155 [Collybiopsis confluens]
MIAFFSLQPSSSPVSSALDSPHALPAGTHEDGVIARQAVDAQSGDASCSTYMCINGTLNENTVEFSLSSTGKKDPGWMAIGFGTSMIDTPMVVMWPNSDGSITLSQRMAASYSMPVVVPDPPRMATISKELSTSAGNGRYVFTIPWDGSADTRLIWAFGSHKVRSSAPDATIAFHYDAGHARFDLSKPLKSTNDDAVEETSTSAPTATPTASPKPTKMTSKPSPPWTAAQRAAFAHAVFCTSGFLVFLPAGALFSRWLRTYRPSWFTAHWVLQFGAAGPAIIIGVLFGVHAVNNNEHRVIHLDDKHKKWGVGLFVLYIFQCLLGAFIHWVKPKVKSSVSTAASRGRRPLQNYLHAIVGLVLIGLGFYQVRNGYRVEWFKLRRGEIVQGDGADWVWDIWIVVVPISYLAGLALLPRQFRQESAQPIRAGSPTNTDGRGRGESSGSEPLLAESSEEVEEIGMRHVYRD